MRSSNIPNTTPDATSIAVTVRFSFRFLFILKRTNSPIPAPEKSPAVITPAEMSPSTQRVESTTDAAQFGISPNMAATKWLSIGTLLMPKAIFFSPMKKTSAFIINVTININNVIVSV